MPRRVKLQDTGEYSTNDKAFQAPNKKYYSSEDAWHKIEEDNKYRSRIEIIVRELLGYEDWQKINAYWYKRLSGWKSYGNDVIFDTIIDKQNDIRWAVDNKDFEKEFNKLSYVAAIIESGLNDTYKRKQARLKEERRAKSDDNAFIVDDIELPNKVFEKHDIRKWVDE